MLRILSGLVLIAVFFSCIWFLPPLWLLAVAEAVLVLAFVEYAGLADALGSRVPRAASAVAAMAMCAAVGLGIPLELPLVAAFVGLGALIVGSRAPAAGVLSDVAAAIFPMVYLGVPLGSVVALHAMAGRESVLLLLLTVIVSDSAQYFTGRWLGRHELSPVISPKKTVEGALGGFVLAPATMVVLAHWWLPGRSPVWVLLVGLAIVGLGIAGDLFESLLKRSAGVKDSSALIPGHGGVLDRIDAMLFAAPVFYVLLKYGG
ncbi:MAG TPA: phosphatidate cytidylyltransferase [Vicinamibacterales bacterium]|jgi:phosphatidate cytidylyltransferase